MTDLEKFVPKAARNEFFYFIARVAMLITCTVGTFMLSRVITQNDVMASNLASLTVDVKLLDQSVKTSIANQGDQLRDHELRLRQNERK